MLRLNGCDGLGLDIPRHWQHLDYTPRGYGGQGVAAGSAVAGLPSEVGDVRHYPYGWTGLTLSEMSNLPAAGARPAQALDARPIDGPYRHGRRVPDLQPLAPCPGCAALSGCGAGDELLYVRPWRSRRPCWLHASGARRAGSAWRAYPPGAQRRRPSCPLTTAATVVAGHHQFGRLHRFRAGWEPDPGP
jgi:hypothetical protein